MAPIDRKRPGRPDRRRRELDNGHRVAIRLSVSAESRTTHQGADQSWKERIPARGNSGALTPSAPRMTMSRVSGDVPPRPLWNPGTGRTATGPPPGPSGRSETVGGTSTRPPACTSRPRSGAVVRAAVAGDSLTGRRHAGCGPADPGRSAISRETVPRRTDDQIEATCPLRRYDRLSV